MREIRTATEIDAPPEIVWEILTDLSTYDEWNPHITAASGDLRENADVKIEVLPPGSQTKKMTATITRLEPPRTLQWVATIPFSWVFEGCHTFELHPIDNDRTQFINYERLSGVLVPFVVSDDAQQGYEAMNDSLAERAEQRFGAVSESNT